MGSVEAGGVETVESRVVWMFGSPRSGSTWLRQMATPSRIKPSAPIIAKGTIRDIVAANGPLD
jgi:hypothetical protein